MEAPIIRRHLTANQIPFEQLMNPAVRGGLTRRKYSVALLDESVALAKQVGPTNASRQTGVGIDSIRKHARARLIESGQEPAALRQQGCIRQKYTDEQKRQCVRLALHYIEHTSGDNRQCWARAGARTGCNGRSIQVQYARGLLVL